MTYLYSILRIFAVLCLLTLAAFPAKSQEISTFFSKDHAVIRVTLAGDAEYSAKLIGGSLVLRLDPSPLVEWEEIKGGLSGLVTEVVQSADRKTVIIGFNQDVRLQDRKDKNVISLYIYPAAMAAQGLPSPEPYDPVKESVKKAEAVQTPLTVRAAQHKDFYRVVFDWPEKIPYTISEGDGELLIEFQAVARDAKTGASKIKSKWIKSATAETVANSTRFKIAYAQPLLHKEFMTGNALALDFTLAPQSESADVPEKTPEPAAPAAEPEVAYDPTREAQFPLPASDRNQDIIDKPKELPKPKAAPVQKPVAAPAPDKSQAAAVRLRGSRGENAATLKFEWTQPTALAIFKRAGYTWMVFDRAGKITTDAETDAVIEVIGGLENLSQPSALILRFKSLAGLEPSVWGDKMDWQIDLKPQRLRPNVAIPVDHHAIAPGQSGVFLSVAQAGRVILLDDPIVGDQIYAATVRTVGRGISGEREFPEFTLLPSLQGIALLPKVDNLKVIPDYEGFLIATDQGLYLSGNQDQKPKASGKKEPEIMYGPEMRDPRKTNPPILKYSEWRGDAAKKFFDKEKDLLNSIGAMPLNERNPARMQLAKLYFAEGWLTEAQGVMTAVEMQADDISKSAEYIAMRGVIQTMQHNFKQALDDLKMPQYDEQSDIATWRAVLAVQQSDWSAASQYFDMSDMPNDGMPPNMRKFVGLSELESAVRNKSYDKARIVLTRLQADKNLMHIKPVLKYWEGEIALGEDKPDEATALWQSTIDSEDPYARPRAEYALIQHGAETETLERKEIIARLERLRFAWRGDKFEFDVLRKLGQMQIEDGLYREGLFTLRRAVANYADQPYAAALADVMSDTFKKLFLDGAADKMAPLTALALFDEFRELTPTGPDGDLIIQRLADRLIEFDLLERAAKLLEHQVNYRLAGADKARIGARLALVYLLDRKPEDALKAIDLSNAPQIPQEIMLERKLLRARAFYDQNKSQEALDLIANEESREARLLKTDIFWRLRNWKMVAQILSGLVEEEEVLSTEAAPEDAAGSDQPHKITISPKMAQWLLSLSVALALDDNTKSLQALRGRYLASMKDTAQYDAFEVITQTENINPTNLAELNTKFDEVAKIESFLSHYQEKIKKGGLSGVN